MPGYYPNKTVTVTIASGQSLSNAVETSGKLASFQMPAAWTAAVITFQGSLDGITYTNIYDNQGNEVQAVVDVDRLVTYDRFEGATFMKFRSGTSGTPVVQAAARTIMALIRKDPIPG